MRKTATILAAALTVTLAACATPTLQTPSPNATDVAREAELQRKFVLQKKLDQQALLYRVAYRLSTGAADLCGNRLTGAIGLLPVTASALAPEYRAIAQEYFGIDDGITVVAIVPGSPASDAGFAAGDRIVRIADRAPPTSYENAGSVEDLFKHSAETHTPITITVRRNAQTIALRITPRLACDFPAFITDDRDINAFADGSRIFVTTGLLGFVKSDQELAVALSHELSHNILRHAAKQKALSGGLLGLALFVAAETGISSGLNHMGLSVGSTGYPIAFEQEADYEGLYVMRHAGYAIDTAADYWRRVAAELPEQITLRNDHPTTAERFLALEAVAREIAAKESANLPLLPTPLQNPPSPKEGRAGVGGTRASASE